MNPDLVGTTFVPPNRFNCFFRILSHWRKRQPHITTKSGYLNVLQNNDVKGAIAIFKLNASEFPNSANVWDSLAEAHLVAGDKIVAKNYYLKSLELNPNNQNAKDMLKKLKQ